MRFEFEPTGEPDIAHGKGTPGRARFFVNSRPAGELQLPYTVPLAFGLGSGMECGRNSGFPVSSRYSSPFAFTGVLDRIVAEVGGKALGDEVEEQKAFARAAMARQ